MDCNWTTTNVSDMQDAITYIQNQVALLDDVTNNMQSTAEYAYDSLDILIWHSYTVMLQYINLLVMCQSYSRFQTGDYNVTDSVNPSYDCVTIVIKGKCKKYLPT